MSCRLALMTFACALSFGCSVVSQKGRHIEHEGGPIAFEPATVEAVGRLALAVEAGDFNGDNKPDLVATDSVGSFLVVLMGKGDGTFAEPVYKSTGRLPRGLAVADLNGDGNLDVVVAGSHTNSACVHLGDGSGAFAFYRDFHAGLRPFAVALGDLNEDGLLDVAVATESNIGKGDEDLVAVLFGDAEGKLGSRIELHAGQFPSDVKIADVNDDHHLDVVVANWGGNSASVFLGDGKGNLESTVTLRPGGRGAPYSVAVADLNGDRTMDIVLSNLIGVASLFPGSGNGEFGKPVNIPTAKGSRSLALADFDGDGMLDIASANTDSDSITVSYADPGGRYGSAYMVAELPSPRWVTVADFDGDGHPDLAATSMKGTVTVLLNRPGSFFFGRSR